MDEADDEREIPGLTLEWSIGRGAFADVWLATNLQNPNIVRAIRYVANREETRHEFDGAKCLQELRQANPEFDNYFLPIQDAGRTNGNGWFYIVTDLADADTADMLRRNFDAATYRALTLQTLLGNPVGSRTLSARESLQLGAFLCSGLALLHEHGFVHQDVKPENILAYGQPNHAYCFGQGWRIADYGFVRRESGGGVVGMTAGFRLPGKVSGYAQDRYALAKTIWVAHTGCPPTAQTEFDRYVATESIVGDDVWSKRLKSSIRLLISADDFQTATVRDELQRLAQLPTVPQAYRLGSVPAPTNAELIDRPAFDGVLRDAWTSGRRLVQVWADGGMGKSSVVWRFLERLRDEGYPQVPQAVDFCFYDQSLRTPYVDSTAMLTRLCQHFGLDAQVFATPFGAAEAVARAFLAIGGVIWLDGVETMQHLPNCEDGAVRDPVLAMFLQILASAPVAPETRAVVLMTTRWPIPNLPILSLALPPLRPEEAVALLRTYAPRDRGPDQEMLREVDGGPTFEQVAEELRYHPLSMTLWSGYLVDYGGGALQSPPEFNGVAVAAERDTRDARHARRVVQAYSKRLDETCQRVFLAIGLFGHTARRSLLVALCRPDHAVAGLTNDLTIRRLNEAIATLRKAGLMYARRPIQEDPTDELLSAHPLILQYAYDRLKSEQPEQARCAHESLFRILCNSVASAVPKDRAEGGTLFEAIAHGIAAGLVVQAFEVLERRLLGNSLTALRQWNAVGETLASLARFLVPLEDGSLDWGQVRPELDDVARLRFATLAGSLLLAGRGWAACEVEQVYAASRSVAERSGTVDDRVDVLLGLQTYRLTRGLMADARHLGMELLDIAAAQSPNEKIRFVAESRLGTIDFFCGEFKDADRRLTYAHELAKEHGPSTYPTDMISEPIVLTLSNRAQTRWSLGNPNAARRDLETALAQSSDHGMAFSRGYAMNYGVWLEINLRDYRTALARSLELLELAGRFGLPAWRATGHMQHGLAKAWLDDDPTEAMQEFNAGCVAWNATGMVLVRTYAEQLAAELWIAHPNPAARRPERAIIHAERAEEAARQLQDDLPGRNKDQGEIERIVGLCRRACGHFDEARRRFRAAYEVGLRQHAPFVRLRAAVALDDLSDDLIPAEADRVRREATAMAREARKCIVIQEDLPDLVAARRALSRDLV